MGTPAFIIYIVLAALGIYVSDLLLDVHVDTIYLGAGDKGICGAGDAFSCADAATSWLSSIGGLPISALGEAFYMAALVLVILGRLKPSMSRNLADLLVLGGLAAAVYSLFLGVMSVVVLGKLCPLCVALYGINIVLFAVALFSHHEGAKAGLRGAVGSFKTGVFWLAVVLMAGGVLATQAMYSARATDAVAKSKNEKAAEPPQKLDVEVGQSPGRGAADAPVVLVEFSDFECPHCKRLSEALKAAAAREPKLFRYHFKHYPMDSSCNRNLEGVMHERACAAAAAMVCADRQGRAWKMHDRLFLNQRALEPKQIETYALSIGLDIEVFRACVQDDATMEVVRQDIAQGDALGVRGTPTWFVNGWKEVGARAPDDLIGIIQHTLRVEKAKKAKKAGAPQEDAAPKKTAAPNTPATP